MSGILKLPNEDQLWLMESFKRNYLSLDGVECLAKMISSGKEGKMTSYPAKAFMFNVVRFPFGFLKGNGVKNSIQIDFSTRYIYFMKKIDIYLTIPFSDVIGCSTNKENHYITLWTLLRKIEFFTDTDHKKEIEQLIWSIIRPNDLEKVQPVVSSSGKCKVIKAPFSRDPRTPFISLNISPELFKEGIVEMKRNTTISRWSKQLLRVEGKEFSYYEPNKPGNALGIVRIDTATLIEPIESEKDSFVVTVNRISHYFRVEKYETPQRTEGERNSWLIAFLEACKENQYMNYMAVKQGPSLPKDEQFAQTL